MISAFPSNLVQTAMGCMTELDPIEVVMNQNIVPFEESSHAEIQIRVVGQEDAAVATAADTAAVVVEYESSSSISNENPITIQLQLEGTNGMSDLQYVLEIQTTADPPTETTTDPPPAIFENGGCEEKQNRVSGAAREQLIHTIHIVKPNTTLYVVGGWATGYSAVTLTDKLVIQPKTSTKEEEEAEEEKKKKKKQPATMDGTKKKQEQTSVDGDTTTTTKTATTTDEDENLMKEALKLAEAIQHQKIVAGKEDESQEEQEEEEEMENVVMDALREERKDKEDPMMDIQEMQDFLARRMKDTNNDQHNNKNENNYKNIAKEKAMLVEQRLHEKRQALLGQYEHTNPERFRQLQEQIMGNKHDLNYQHHRARPRRRKDEQQQHMTLDEMKNRAAAAAGGGRRHDEAFEKHMKERRERMEAKMRDIKSKLDEDGLHVPVPPQEADAETPGVDDDDDDEKDDDDEAPAYPKHRRLFESDHVLDLRQYFLGVIVFLLGMIGTIQMCLWTSRLEKGRRDL